MSNVSHFVSLLREHCSKNYVVKTIAIKLNSKEFLPNADNSYSSDNVITFRCEDTLKTAVELKTKGLKPLVLILADENTPGGTFVSGYQEESLFRRTALMAHLTKDMYPIQNDEIIYAPNVGVFNLNDLNRDFTEKWNLDFVALPSVRNYYKQPELRNIMKNKLRMLFNLYKYYGHNILVLGAMGSGTFGCNANAMAVLIKEVISEYKNLIIVFSISGPNYNIYKQCFHK